MSLDRIGMLKQRNKMTSCWLNPPLIKKLIDS